MLLCNILSSADSWTHHLTSTIRMAFFLSQWFTPKTTSPDHMFLTSDDVLFIHPRPFQVSTLKILGVHKGNIGQNNLTQHDIPCHNMVFFLLIKHPTPAEWVPLADFHIALCQNNYILDLTGYVQVELCHQQVKVTCPCTGSIEQYRSSFTMSHLFITFDFYDWKLDLYMVINNQPCWNIDTCNLKGDAPGSLQNPWFRVTCTH